VHCDYVEVLVVVNVVVVVVFVVVVVVVVDLDVVSGGSQAALRDKLLRFAFLDRFLILTRLILTRQMVVLLNYNNLRHNRRSHSSYFLQPTI
jgi:hypothetical protein